MTESQFLDGLIGKRGLLPMLGWRFTHSRPARIVDANQEDGYGWRTPIQGMPGFPDILAAKLEAQRIIFAELKGEKGKPTSWQIEWLDLLAYCHQEVYLWRPSDLEEIQSILEAHRDKVIWLPSLKSAWVNRRAEYVKIYWV